MLNNYNRITEKWTTYISWQFIDDLYLRSTESRGLSTQHKLKYEHPLKSLLTHVSRSCSTGISLGDWEEEVKLFCCIQEEKDNMMLSRQILYGIKMTGKVVRLHKVSTFH